MAEWGDRGGFRASPHKFTAETPRSYFKCIEVLNYFDHFDSEETDAGMVVAAVFVADFVGCNHFRTLKGGYDPREKCLCSHR